MSMTAYNILECREKKIYFYNIFYMKDTRPSGERESGSYSGTRQRNRIQFGPS